MFLLERGQNPGEEVAFVAPLGIDGVPNAIYARGTEETDFITSSKRVHNSGRFFLQ